MPQRLLLFFLFFRGFRLLILTIPTAEISEISLSARVKNVKLVIEESKFQKLYETAQKTLGESLNYVENAKKFL